MNDNILIFSPPKPKWEFSLTADFRFRWKVRTAPNRFHRFTQRWLLGIHWRRV